jgi:pimeloyl-ACP methyl ester carboxylesterase
VPALARRGRTILVDLKGFGASPKPDDDAYAPGDQVDLVHGIIRDMDLADLTLMGHSLGGGVALLAALRLLDEGMLHALSGLVLVAAAAFPQRLPPFVALARYPGFSSAMMRALGARFVVRQALRSMVYDPSDITPEQVEGYAPPLESPAAHRALIRTALQILPEDLDVLSRRYGQLDVPALLLWGRQDRVVPLAVGRRLAATLPRAELVVLERCGHLPAEERPAESLAAVTAFLEEIDRPPR